MNNDHGEQDHEGHFLEPSVGDELLAAFNNADLALAVTLLRKITHLEQPYLAAIADMLDDNLKTDTSVAEQLFYRLVLAPRGTPGRKRRGSRIKALTPHTRKSKEPPPYADLRWKVHLVMGDDATLALGAAITAVAEAESVSRSLVEKAYYQLRRRRNDRQKI